MKNLPYILLVDDDPDDREALMQPFGQQHPDVKVVAFEDGRALLDFLEHCPSAELPAMILMDFKMPYCTAAEILEKLGSDERYSDILKLVWSTSGRPDFVDQCFRHGADLYLTKPNSLPELASIVERISGALNARLMRAH